MDNFSWLLKCCLLPPEFTLGARLVFHLQMQGVTHGLSAGLPYPSSSEVLSNPVTLSSPWQPFGYWSDGSRETNTKSATYQTHAEAGTATFVPVLRSCPCHGSLPLWMLSQSSTAASQAPAPDAAVLIHTAGEGKLKCDHGERFKSGKPSGHYIPMP